MTSSSTKIDLNMKLKEEIDEIIATLYSTIAENFYGEEVKPNFEYRRGVKP